MAKLTRRNRSRSMISGSIGGTTPADAKCSHTATPTVTSMTTSRGHLMFHRMWEGGLRATRRQGQSHGGSAAHASGPLAPPRGAPRARGGAPGGGGGGGTQCAAGQRGVAKPARCSPDVAESCLQPATITGQHCPLRRPRLAADEVGPAYARWGSIKPSDIESLKTSPATLPVRRSHLGS